MSMQAIRWARGARGMTATQKAVLLILADSANDQAEAWPSAGAIAADACMTDRAVRGALGALEAGGWIRGERAIGRATRWVVCLDREAGTPERRSEGYERPSYPHPPEPRNVVHTTPEPSSYHPGTSFIDPGTSFIQNPKEPSVNPKRTPSTPPKPPPSKIALPDWLPPGAWADWCEYRKRRSGWTQRAAELSIRNLSQLRADGSDPQAVIEQSIANGWRGLFPIRANGRAPPEPNKRAWIFDEIAEQRRIIEVEP